MSHLEAPRHQVPIITSSLGRLCREVVPLDTSYKSVTSGEVSFPVHALKLPVPGTPRIRQTELSLEKVVQIWTCTGRDPFLFGPVEKLVHKAEAAEKNSRMSAQIRIPSYFVKMPKAVQFYRRKTQNVVIGWASDTHIFCGSLPPIGRSQSVPQGRMEICSWLKSEPGKFLTTLCAAEVPSDTGNTAIHEIRAFFNAQDSPKKIRENIGFDMAQLLETVG